MYVSIIQSSQPQVVRSRFQNVNIAGGRYCALVANVVKLFLIPQFQKGKKNEIEKKFLFVCQLLLATTLHGEYMPCHPYFMPPQCTVEPGN